MNIEMPQPHQQQSLRALWREAFDDPEADIDAFMQTAFHPARCRCAVVDGEIVAALYWLECSAENRRIAYLYAVATAKKYRGVGICRALMDNTHRYLRAGGFSGAILAPGSETLFGFYRRMGYRTCSSIREFQCRSGGMAETLRQISAEEYAKLRRRLLPPGGVIQEGENLALLQTQEQLYAGEKCILAAHREEDVLIGTELLGDVSAAPGILRALACTQGRFRAPGEDREFAMYLSLAQDEHPAPSYFGLAFD